MFIYMVFAGVAKAKWRRWEKGRGRRACRCECHGLPKPREARVAALGRRATRGGGARPSQGQACR